jgi:hypothetical protein
VLEGKKKGKMPRKPAVLRPKSELDCQHCMEEKVKKANPEQNKAVVAWSERRGRCGRRKSFSTEGYFCSNKGCEYYGIRDERIHALVGDGSHGKHQEIRDLKYQVCQKKFQTHKYRAWKHQLALTILGSWFVAESVSTGRNALKKPGLAVEYEVDALPNLSVANVRELLRASMPLPQLSPEDAASLVVTHLVNRTRSRKSRLRHRKDRTNV